MDDPALSAVRARVAALRARHVVIAAIAAAVGLGALGLGAVLGEAEAPIGARLFFCLAGLAVAGWQVWLGSKIGRGVAALDAGRAVTWVYVLSASINGSAVGTSVMLGLDRGELYELPLAHGSDPKPVLEAVARAHPRAAVGYDTATQARFAADPRSVLRPG